jgi:hypothetical protein
MPLIWMLFLFAMKPPPSGRVSTVACVIEKATNSSDTRLHTKQGIEAVRFCASRFQAQLLIDTVSSFFLYR